MYSIDPELISELALTSDKTIDKLLADIAEYEEDPVILLIDAIQGLLPGLDDHWAASDEGIDAISKSMQATQIALQHRGNP